MRQKLSIYNCKAEKLKVSIFLEFLKIDFQYDFNQTINPIILVIMLSKFIIIGDCKDKYLEKL